MEDLIIKELRKIKNELEHDSKNDFKLIFKKHNELNQIYKNRIVSKEDLGLNNEVSKVFNP